MPQLRRLLLEVWREACQHIEIQRSTEGIAALLQSQLPLERLEVYRVEPEQRMVARVAITPPNADAPAAAFGDVKPAPFKKLVAWIRRGEITGDPGDHGLVPLLEPLSLTHAGQPVRLVALKHGPDTLGVLLIFAEAEGRFTREHEEIIRLLQEPFAAALANDRRLNELAALREAAEADRRSLLRRLGRSDISDQIVGEREGLAQVMSRVELVAQSDAPVLLLGETGSGKEVVARAIHLRGNRHEGSFIRVNCGAIPADLIDSQLFGHEKGAFTGATDVHRGWFERADGGTLFLDEIGELPPEAQVRFLRVLQDGFIERVGGGVPIRVDVRVVAATHRDLAFMVQQGSFREDLWYRIAVFPILLPPLRDRAGDIPALAEHFARRAATRFGLPFVEPTPTDVQTLRGYDWPGNIRELASVIDRAAILGEGRSLEIQAALGFAAPKRADSQRETVPTGASVGIATLDDAMRRHIESVLGHTGGRVEGIGGAAELLAINPHTLRARMRKLGIDWAAFRVSQGGH